MQHVGLCCAHQFSICCVEMLRAFGQLPRNISQHDPTMLRYDVLKCCERSAGSLGLS